MMMFMMEVEVTQMHLLYPDATPPYILQLIPSFWCTKPIKLKISIFVFPFYQKHNNRLNKFNLILLFGCQRAKLTDIWAICSQDCGIMGCESIFIPGGRYIHIGQFGQQ